jgi:hypothetical protein
MGGTRVLTRAEIKRVEKVAESVGVGGCLGVVAESNGDVVDSLDVALADDLEINFVSRLNGLRNRDSIDASLGGGCKSGGNGGDGEAHVEYFEDESGLCYARNEAK